MIILYGGSFNPPTVAHFEIAKYLISKYQPHKFIFVPVGDKYAKSEIAPFYHRYAMLKIMSNKLINTSVSDFENKMINFTGTITTLEYYQTLYPNQQIIFVLGADNLLSLDKWIKVEEMLKKFYFIVLNRNSLNVNQLINANNLLRNYHNKFIIEESFPKIDLSSSMYRKDFCDNVVLQEVNEYIYQHNLYNRGVL